MSNPWQALMPFPSGAPANGTGIVAGDLTNYPLTWSIEEMTKIEWMWKKLVANLTAGSVTVTDVFGSNTYAIAPLTGESTNTTATNWRQLVPGPGFPIARSFTVGIASEIPGVSVLGVLGVMVVSVNCSLSGLWMLPGGTHTCTKSLVMSVTASLSEGEANAQCWADSYNSSGRGAAGNWTAFGDHVPYALGDSSTGPFTVTWATPPVLTMTSPEPFIPAPGPIG